MYRKLVANIQKDEKIFYVVVAFLFTAISIQAQKIDARLTALLSSSNRVMSANKASRSMEMDTAAVKNEINVNFHSDCTVKSFSVIAMLKDGVVCPTERLQMLGVKIRDVIGRMLILTVPAESLLTLDDIDEIESVSADQMNQIMNNIAREKSRVTEVATPEKAQQHNLPQAYTGKGVLVGLVDTGIDFNHAAFRNPDGSTRIKLAMKIVSGELKVYTTPEEIAALTSDRTDESHGTHVAGIAAGSFIEGLNRQGVAPEADLMLCGLGTYLYESEILTAITKMFDYAKEQGMPCVVNASMGNVSDFHDGTSTAVVRGLREYYQTEDDWKGRICVFSAGNSGDAHAAIYSVLPEADSDLTYDDVRSLIRETSYNDEYTTNPYLIPSWNVIQAGAGKIDALAGLEKLVGTTAIQMVGEDGPRHATPATMHDVDGNCYNTLGQRVSKNTKGIVIYKGKLYVNP